MKHATLEDLQSVAAVNAEPSRPLSAAERINRWADLLEQRGSEQLTTLIGTEHQPPAVRARMRSTNSALSVAFADPILRGDGLTDETYGAAKRYFGLSEWQLHDIICHCHYGATTSALATSRRVRSLASQWLPSLVERARRIFAG
jgi:hypothetical protein